MAKFFKFNSGLSAMVGPSYITQFTFSACVQFFSVAGFTMWLLMGSQYVGMLLAVSHAVMFLELLFAMSSGGGLSNGFFLPGSED